MDESFGKGILPSLQKVYWVSRRAEEVKTRSDNQVTTESESDRDPETAERKQ